MAVCICDPNRLDPAHQDDCHAGMIEVLRKLARSYREEAETALRTAEGLERAAENEEKIAG